MVVRKELAIALRDLLQHGLMEVSDDHLSMISSIADAFVQLLL